MTFVSCSIPEQYVNPLFEVFDGGDFVLSSYRDIEESFTRVRIFLESPDQADAATARLKDALTLVGLNEPVERGEIADEDWKFAYRRHFHTEKIGCRLVTVPVWELDALDNAEGREVILLDPGMAFGTGKHETTHACLEYIEELAPSPTHATSKTFLDMGCGSGILSIAAAKLGYAQVEGFDVDAEAVASSCENAERNKVAIPFFRYGLGARVKRPLGPADVVVANILGPLLIRFADEIVLAASDKLIISGILTTLYPDVLAAFVTRDFVEVSRRTLGEWTTGLLTRTRPNT